MLNEAGIVPVTERWTGEVAHYGSFEDEVQTVRRRLCLPADRDDEVAAPLHDLPSVTHETVTYAWPGNNARAPKFQSSPKPPRSAAAVGPEPGRGLGGGAPSALQSNS